jgi:hypothetical protein
MKILKVIGLSILLSSTSAWSVTLIKNDEAKQAPASGVMNTRGISRGPGIKLVSPAPGSELTSPCDLNIAFEPRGGAKIDPASVKVVYLRAQPIDLVPRLKGALSEQGIALSSAETPPGEHQIQITLQDSEGRISNSIIQLNVK